MREYLALQVNEKKQKEIVEKGLHDEQATIWKKDKELQDGNEQKLN